MEKPEAVAVRVQVGGAPAALVPLADPARESTPGAPAPAGPAGASSTPLAFTGAPIDLLVAVALALIVLGAVAAAAARTRLENPHRA